MQDDHPFRVIDGDAPATPERRVTSVLEYEGVRLVFRGNMEVWELEDPGAWVGVPLSECPPYVAFVLLGLSGQPRVPFAPGDAVDVIEDALHQGEELTPGRARVLGAIPRESEGFSSEVPQTASLEFWWGRWWEGLKDA